MQPIDIKALPRFDRDFFTSDQTSSYIGGGSIGGKASGLVFIKDFIRDKIDRDAYPRMAIRIPRFVILGTDVFDRFMELNNLYDVALSDQTDDRISHAFQQAEFPPELVGDMRAVITSAACPLAVRSSSLLEDAMYEPFAGVYATKMIPNNQSDPGTRFKKLIEAVKFVFSSVFFKGARDYIEMTGKASSDEKMAVIIQEVVGMRHNDAFYPHLSGVARSYNFYPAGRALPEQGVVDLALGLGKQIVDGGLVWTYSPAFPKISPPVASPRELLQVTQTNFWAVNMGKPSAYDPILETEYLCQCDLAAAEYDGTLPLVASTYRPQDDRLLSGTGPDGPRAITFAPILVDNELPLNKLLMSLLKLCEEAIGSEVEIEFAMTMEGAYKPTAEFGFLQVRPMVVSHMEIEVAEEEMTGDTILAASARTMGNAMIDSITDIVYVKPDVFEAKNTRRIAEELGQCNRRLVNEKRKYVLIGFGRWGSSDPWLGIPVEWSQIGGAGVLVEATLPDMDVELSQGSHFFHNLSSFQICYLSVHHSGKYAIDWNWLAAQQEIMSTEFIRHVRLEHPVTIKVDGRNGRGVIKK